MSVFIIVLGLLVTLAVLSVLAARARRSGRSGVDPHSVRRLFQYVVIYGLVMVVAYGAARLIARIPGLSSPSFDDSYQLGQALGFVLVGIPLLGGLLWWTRRQHRADPGETASVVYAAYLTLTALVSVVLATLRVRDLIAQLVEWSRPDGDSVGHAVVWTAVWLVHWGLIRRHLHEQRNSPHLLLGAAWGLFAGAVGLISTLGVALDLLIWQPTILGGTTGVLAESAALLIIGGLVWIRYWVRGAAHVPRGTGWLAYVLLLGVAGGFITAVVAASRLLWLLVVWLVGDPVELSAAQHFDTATTELAAAVIGFVVWWYHRATLGTTQAEHRDVRRVYHYVLAALALIVAAVGLGSLVLALVESATPGLELGMTTRNTWLAGITVLVISVPIWWTHWRRITAMVTADPAEEVGALPRRIFWVLLFGVSVVAVVIVLLSVGLTIFGDLVAGDLGATTWRSIAAELGVLVAVAAVVAYHASVFRTDRAVPVAQPVVVGPRSVLLIGAVNPVLANTLREATGAQIQMWQRRDVEPPAWDETEVLTALAEHLDEDVVVIADDAGLRLVVAGP